jgi:hypothetical protein
MVINVPARRYDFLEGAIEKKIEKKREVGTPATLNNMRREIDLRPAHDSGEPRGSSGLA